MICQSQIICLFFAVHFRINQITNKTVQTLTLTGSIVLDYLPFSFGNKDIDPVVCLFVIPSGSFLLGFVMLIVFIRSNEE